MIVNFSNYINESIKNHLDIDPYSEEEWDEDEMERGRLARPRADELFDEYMNGRRRGDEMLAGWAGQRNLIKPKFYEKDKKIGNFTTDVNYGDNVGNLIFSDYGLYVWE